MNVIMLGRRGDEGLTLMRENAPNAVPSMLAAKAAKYSPTMQT